MGSGGAAERAGYFISRAEQAEFMARNASGVDFKRDMHKVARQWRAMASQLTLVDLLEAIDRG